MPGSPPVTSNDRFNDDEIEAGRKLFASEISFVLGAARLDQLPAADRPEIAFAGRSNVGKSSLINALVNRKQLARASGEPGRTQQLNFFDLSGGPIYLVDLPGYGFATAPKKMVEGWTQLMRDYLRGRPNLKRVFLLIDSRRGVGPHDAEMMDVLDGSAVIYQIVLTKADKLRPSELPEVEAGAAKSVAKRPAAHPELILTSSDRGDGLELLRAEVAKLIP
ncbi:YihA family ribosome biogenesis GTP-binding protein [bacterium]|nr:YihA family ribosome biogenesis GTP-binding protein [bacterium]